MEAFKLVKEECGSQDVGRTIKWGGRYYEVVDVGSAGLTLKPERSDALVHKTYQLLKFFKAEWAKPAWERPESAEV